MKTYQPSALAAVCIVILVLTSCRNEPDAPTVNEDSTEAASAPMDATVENASAAADQATADPDRTRAAESASLGVLNAINDHEISAGKQAQAKGVSGDVAEYAKMMIEEHSKNRAETSALGPDEQASDAQAQRQAGEKELASLEAKAGADYASAYVAAMVKGHQDALKVLDDRLIPSATRPEVRAHLSTTREHVAHHLERAKELQNTAQ